MTNVYPLRSSSGDETFNGGEPPMDARLAKLEASMEYVQRDVSDIKTDIRRIQDAVDSKFLLTFGSLIVVAVGLAGIMAKGFGWL
jgi:hypothetical protein